MATHFTKLNHDWNAEPNAPDPRVTVDETEVRLEFLANPFVFKRFVEGQVLRLRFKGATRYRLGRTNDEGWYRGQCRFSSSAPDWGEFYEVTGDLRLGECPEDWVTVDKTAGPPRRHFLFYLRDQTFECAAADWTLEITEELRP